MCEYFSQLTHGVEHDAVTLWETQERGNSFGPKCDYCEQHWTQISTNIPPKFEMNQMNLCWDSQRIDANILPIISQIIQSNRNDFDDCLQTIIRFQPAAGILTDDLTYRLVE